ncbi:MAG: hypothetical protein WCI02_13385 [Planctomycetota bacterium]
MDPKTSRDGLHRAIIQPIVRQAILCFHVLQADFRWQVAEGSHREFLFAESFSLHRPRNAPSKESGWT